MVSEIQHLKIPGQIPAQTTAPPARTAVTQPAPRVTEPKPVEINFDPVKSRQNLKEAVSALNEQMASTKTGLGFYIDESLNRPVVTVRNVNTGEVVRQIPNEVVIQVAHSIDELKGVLLNAQV
jgi:flagellar protein FlaG